MLRLTLLWRPVVDLGCLDALLLRRLRSARPIGLAVLGAGLFLLLALLNVQAAAAATYVVTSTGDGNDSLPLDGICSDGISGCTLRAAITQGNATGVATTIHFAIQPGGPQTISPSSNLPPITVPVTIDGTTQASGQTGPGVIQLHGGIAGAANGLMIQGAGSTIKGLIINGFSSGSGILVQAGNASVIDNMIGVDATGTSAVANNYGVVVQNAPGAKIGGPTSGAGNILSGNSTAGVYFSGSGAASSTVQGNFIGTDLSGSAAVPNGNGVYVESTPGLVIGGTGTGAGNVISGNTGKGVFIGADGVKVQGNLIGVNAAGTAGLGNHDGVFTTTTNTTVGGIGTGARNVLSGNVSVGVYFFSPLAGGGKVQGNFIGTNAAGTAALPNGIGMYFHNAPNGTVGGSATGAGNLISGNFGNGILIYGTSAAPTIQGNLIGTDINGTAAIGNGNGIFVDQSSPVTIGGTSVGARNVISGNAATGVYIFHLASVGAKIQGNYIGTTIDGTAALGNKDGVFIDNAPNATIGGPVANAGNLISGNQTSGVTVAFDGAAGATIAGNLIGTNANGNAALGNGTGVLVNGAPNTTIGGTTAIARNVISGNAGAGVFINQAGATGAKIQGNSIGTDAAGTVPLGNATGVLLDNAAQATIGGTASGVGNIIANSATRGVAVDGGARNAIQGNSIFSNSQLGIDLGADGVTANDSLDGDSGSNNLQNYPVLTAVSPTSIQGTLNSTPSTAYRLEFFNTATCDAGGFGEGRTFLASTNVTTNGGGNASFNVPVSLSSGQVTATATDPAGNTSEFSACRPVAGAASGPTLTLTAEVNAITLGWTGGAAAALEYVARFPNAREWVVAPVPPTLTDSAPPSGLNCYVLVPLNEASLPLGQSDLLCGQLAYRSATGAPGNFALKLNQSTVAQLNWTAPGGQAGYFLLAVPLDSSAPRVAPVAAGQTTATDNTGGVPTCYVLFANFGSSLGNSDLVCGIPGFASGPSAATAEADAAATGATAENGERSNKSKTEARKAVEPLESDVDTVKKRLGPKLEEGVKKVQEKLKTRPKDRNDSGDDDQDAGSPPDRVVPDGVFLDRARNGSPLARFGGENVYDTAGDGEGGRNVANGDGPRIVGSKSIPFRIQNDGGRAGRIEVQSISGNRDLTDITISVNGLSPGDTTDQLDQPGEKLDGNIVIKVGRKAAKGQYVVKIVLQADGSTDPAQSDSVTVRFRV